MMYFKGDMVLPAKVQTTQSPFQSSSSMTPRIRAKHILSRMWRFSYADEPRLVKLFEKTGIVLDDGLIGVYQNDPDTLEDAVIVLEEEIVVFEHGVGRSIRYDEIQRTAPVKNDGLATEIIVILKDGKHFPIPVRGRDGRFQDIFGFLRFVHRASSDMAST